MRSLSALTVLGVLALGWPAITAAQTERRIEEKARAALQPTEQEILAGERRFVLDYGLWVNHLFTKLINDDNDETTDDATSATYAIDPRFWLRATLRPPADGSYANEHSLYLRFKDPLTWREPSDANGSFDQDGPHVDYAFLTLDIRPVWLQIGRRLYQAGQGLAYSNVGDGIELQATFPTWSLVGFASRSVPHEANIDLSVPGGKHSGRTFYGIEGRYIGIPNRGVYGYVVFQRDDGDEEPDDLTREYDYDSQYFAIGSEGTAVANVRYAAELILETGESFTSVTDEQKDIQAWAMDVSLVYDVQAPMQPTLYGEYAFGSGDSDRVNVTNTVGGNLAGKDTNFLYFGFLPTGYALSPRVSNLRMIKVGAAIKPLERFSRFKDLTTSVDVYRYYKDESKGGIFDPQASGDDDDVGFEIDLTLSWPIVSDLSLDIEYGHFQPGDAYPVATDDPSEYFSVALTSTF